MAMGNYFGSPFSQYSSYPGSPFGRGLSPWNSWDNSLYGGWPYGGWPYGDYDDDEVLEYMALMGYDPCGAEDIYEVGWSNGANFAEMMMPRRGRRRGRSRGGLSLYGSIGASLTLGGGGGMSRPRGIGLMPGMNRGGGMPMLLPRSLRN